MTSPSSQGPWGSLLHCLQVLRLETEATQREGSRRKSRWVWRQRQRTNTKLFLKYQPGQHSSETLRNRSTFQVWSHSDQLPGKLEPSLSKTKNQGHYNQIQKVSIISFHLTLNYFKTTSGGELMPPSRIHISLLETWLWPSPTLDFLKFFI